MGRGFHSDPGEILLQQLNIIHLNTHTCVYSLHFGFSLLKFNLLPMENANKFTLQTGKSQASNLMMSSFQCVFVDTLSASVWILRFSPPIFQLGILRQNEVFSRDTGEASHWEQNDNNWPELDVSES